MHSMDGGGSSEGYNIPPNSLKYEFLKNNLTDLNQIQGCPLIMIIIKQHGLKLSGGF